MMKKMKIPFLNKNSSSSSSPSHQIPNPKSCRPNNVDQQHSESIENIIKTLKSSKRLFFETKGDSNSILEEATEKENELKAFTLFSMESNDPYSDFKNSMKAMVEAQSLHHDWISLEKLLFWFLKVNVNSSHAYIFAAFVDFLLDLAVTISKDVVVDVERSRSRIVEETPSSPLSFYTSNSSSDETLSSSVSVRFLPLPVSLIGEKRNDVVCTLSSLFEMEE